LLGRVGHDFDHAGLAVDKPAGEAFADVGFPLPGLIPPGVERVDTPLAELAVSKTERGTRVEWLDGVPDGPRALELFGATVSAAEYDSHWHRTFAPGSKFLTHPSMRATSTTEPSRTRTRGARGRPALASAGAIAPASRRRALGDLRDRGAELVRRAVARLGEDRAHAGSASRRP
jgi:hypothetical protein